MLNKSEYILIILVLAKHYKLAKASLYTLREEPIQINVILQHNLPAAKLSVVCTVYKQ